MHMPAVSELMTRNPWTIQRTASLADAHALMREHDIRHLPVLDEGGELCGILSERDMLLVETLADTAPGGVLVEEAMTEKPFIVTGDAPLDEVAAIMGEHKYGSVVVMGREGVEGIFTATDALQALARTLTERQISDILETRP